MKDKKSVDYGGELRALFMGKDGNRQLPDVENLENCLWRYLKAKHKKLVSKCVNVEGIELYYYELGRTEMIDYEVSAFNVLQMFVEEYKDWRKVATKEGSWYDDETTNSVNQPLITSVFLGNVLQKLNDFSSIEGCYGPLDDNDNYSDYHFFSNIWESIIPDVNTEEANKNWRALDKSDFIEFAGVITTFLNDNLPDWVVGRDTIKEAA